MSRTVSSLLAAALVLAATPSFAAAGDAIATPAAGAATVVPKAGQFLRDASGRRLGAIDSVRGSDVYVIMDMRMVRIPVSTLSAGEKGLQTSLTRADLH